MSLQATIQEMRPAIETVLQQTVWQAVPDRYPDLRRMLAYHMGWEGEGAGLEAQGKRIRPLLVLLCAQAAGGKWQDALPAAAAVELLHNFSLVHDDIQDNSELRRNRPTVWVKWGVAQAINVGDILFILAFQALNGLDQTLPSQAVLQANHILQQACLRLTEGQYLDISYEARSELALEDYWPMIGGKTSALLRCCAELGALSAGADEAQRACFGEYGYALGLAFQVLDDWLGIWGDVALTGKSVASDLAAGKKTIPVIYGLSKGGAFSKRWKQGAIPVDEAPELARILDEEGANAFTLQTAEQLTNQARQALQKAAGAGPAAESLQELTRMLLNRKS